MQTAFRLYILGYWLLIFGSKRQLKTVHRGHLSPN